MTKEISWDEAERRLDNIQSSDGIENCSSCRFSEVVDSAYYKCRRYPPLQEFYWHRFKKWRRIKFPMVEWNMWCGEYKAKVTIEEI